MLLGTIFLRHGRVILRDVDGSEVALSIEDALTFRKWLYMHSPELTEAQLRMHLHEQTFRNHTQDTTEGK